jgi:hypothetical protein
VMIVYREKRTGAAGPAVWKALSILQNVRDSEIRVHSLHSACLGDYAGVYFVPTVSYSVTAASRYLALFHGCWLY